MRRREIDRIAGNEKVERLEDILLRRIADRQFRNRNFLRCGRPNIGLPELMRCRPRPAASLVP